MNDDFLVAGLGPIVEGSKPFGCFECEGTVWVAPSGQELLIQHPELRVICMGCMKAKDPNFDEFVFDLTEEQKAELKKKLGFVPTEEEMRRVMREVMEHPDD